MSGGGSVGRIDRLKRAVAEEAAREFFPIDLPVYEAAGMDPNEPVLYAGNLDAAVGFFGRDLGRDEVRCGEPLIGAAGRKVRHGVHKALFGSDPQSSEDLSRIVEHVFLSNTVPYKPPGNKVYPEAVRRRFRPFIEELLVERWSGSVLISLGNVATRWFRPYLDRKEFDDFWADLDRRYRDTLPVEVFTPEGRSRTLLLAPLPHPSPLNQRWYGLFPGLLADRLRGHLC